MSVAATAVADEVTASQVLERCNRAMSAPIRYSLHSDGTVTVVSQKMLGNRLMTRLDVDAPIRKATIVLEDTIFEEYPDHGVVFDLSFMRRQAGGAWLPEMPESTSQLPAETTASLLDFEMHNSTNCYVVEILVDAGEPVSGVIPDVVRASRKKVRKIIRADNFYLVEVSGLLDNGSAFTKATYRDVNSEDFPDTVFLPSDGLEVIELASAESYTKAITELLVSAGAANRAARHADAREKLADISAAFKEADDVAAADYLATAEALMKGANIPAKNIPEKSSSAFILISPHWLH